jgi:hypothetical protein
VSLELVQKRYLALEKLMQDFAVIFQAKVELDADTCLQRNNNEPMTTEQGERQLALTTALGGTLGSFRETLQGIRQDNISVSSIPDPHASENGPYRRTIMT